MSGCLQPETNCGPMEIDLWDRGPKGDKGDRGERGLPGTPGSTRGRDGPCILDYVGGTYGGDPTGTNSSSVAVRAFMEDCRTYKAIGDMGPRVSIWAVDHDDPILIPSNCGMAAPRRTQARLGWQLSDNQISDVLITPGCTFLVDVTGPNRMVPKFAMQGDCSISNINFVGADLLASKDNIDVSEYGVNGSNVIYGSPTVHAPVLVTDHRHDDAGALVPYGTKAKAGGILLENIRLVGLYDGIYLGDPLIDEEPWAASVSSGLQTGMASITIDGVGGAVLHRAITAARVTTGGMQVLNAHFIPPEWTGISQPIPAGPDYKMLKWAQEFGTAFEFWHRAVGLYFNHIGLRGFRRGFYFRAGAGLGPDGQDTGKINQSRFLDIGCERVPTLMETDEYSYLHADKVEASGHYMNFFNPAGCNANMFQINTNGNLAGAVDKHIDQPYLVGHDYLVNDKVNSGGRIYKVIVAGRTPDSGPGPSSTDGSRETIGTAQFVYRNDSFKNAGDYNGWTNSFDLNIQELAGGLIENTEFDPHHFYNFRYVRVGNWRQSNGAHNQALFVNRSPSAVLRVSDGVIQPTTGSKRVFDVLDSKRLDVGFVRFAGYDPTRADDGTPADPNLVNVPGVDFSMATISNFDVVVGDDGDNDDTDDGDGGDY